MRMLLIFMHRACAIRHRWERLKMPQVSLQNRCRRSTVGQCADYAITSKQKSLLVNAHKVFLVSCAALPMLWTTPVASTELVYTPVNPVFGGNPLNGSVLLNAAQAQNKTKDPQDALTKDLNNSPLQQFNDTLQRSVLSRLAAGATSQVLNSNGRLVPGRVETGNFLISITDQGGGVLLITTTDKLSGNATSFQVSQ